MTIYDVKCSSQILIQIRHKFFMLFACNSQSDFKTYRVQDKARIGRGYETDCLTSRQSGKRSQDNTSVTRLKTQVWHASKMCIGQTVYMWERLFEYRTDCLHVRKIVWVSDRLSDFETLSTEVLKTTKVSHCVKYRLYAAQGSHGTNCLNMRQIV